MRRFLDFLTTGWRFRGSGRYPGGRPLPFPAGWVGKAGEPNSNKKGRATRWTCLGVKGRSLPRT